MKGGKIGKGGGKAGMVKTPALSPTGKGMKVKKG